MSKPNPPARPTLLPFQQENVATNQQQIPLPYLAGERLIAGRFITGAMNEMTQRVPTSGKKG